MKSTSVFVNGSDLGKPLASARCLSSMDFPQGREIIFVCEYKTYSFLKLLDQAYLKIGGLGMVGIGLEYHHR